MGNIINQIHKLLIKTGKTVSVAESCTGGILSSILTQLPGSSQYFILGVVAYSNRSKEKLLGMPGNIIAVKGAVSREVAFLLARRIRLSARTDFGLGITGIAGPSGGSKTKPVGTVFIALDGKKKRICRKFFFRGTRQQIRKKSALAALKLLKVLT